MSENNNENNHNENNHNNNEKNHNDNEKNHNENNHNDNQSDQNDKKYETIMSIIPDALKYYDDNKEKYLGLRKKIKYYKIPKYGPQLSSTFFMDEERNKKFKDNLKPDDLIFTFYDENENILFSSRMEVIGTFLSDWRAWIWAWSLPHSERNHIMTVKKVLYYILDMDMRHNGILSLESLILKNTLITSRSLITSEIQIDINCSLAAYLSKKRLIIPMFTPDKSSEELKDIIKMHKYYDYDLIDNFHLHYNVPVYYMIALDIPDYY